MALPTPPIPNTNWQNPAPFQLYSTSGVVRFPIGAEVMFDPTLFRSAAIQFINGTDEYGVQVKFNVVDVRGVRGVVELVDGSFRGVRFPFHTALLKASIDFLVSYAAPSYSFDKQTIKKSIGPCVCALDQLLRGGCACGSVTRYVPPGIIT